MNRRVFFSFMTFLSSTLMAIDFRKDKPEAWLKSSLNEAATSLYGKKKFSSIKESERVKIEADNFVVPNPNKIPIKFKSDIEAKSVALFQTANEQSLVCVFNIEDGMLLDYEVNIRMQMKGTLFVVVEGLDNKLYYARHFIDVHNMNCIG